MCFLMLLLNMQMESVFCTLLYGKMPFFNWRILNIWKFVETVKKGCGLNPLGCSETEFLANICLSHIFDLGPRFLSKEV